MEQLTSLVEKLVAIRSAYPDEVELQAFIASYFLKKGFRVELQQVEGDRANIVVEKGCGDKTVLLYSHLDTVPVASGWTGDPLVPRRKGDRLYGLGAFDMKGGMAVNIRTFLDFEPKRIKLRLLFAVDEEYVSKGGHVFSNSPPMGDIAAVLSPEPAFAHGVNGIVTGRIGRAVIMIRLKRPSQHFYYYEPEGDISLTAASIITSLKKLYRGNDGKKEFAFVRAMHAQSSGMSTPESVELELDTSLPAPQTPEAMLQAVQKTVRAAIGTGQEIEAEVIFKQRPTPFLAGYELKRDDPYLHLMAESVQTVTGKEAVPYFRSSVADENIFGAAGKSVLGIGPEGGNAHGADEWVSIGSLKKLKDIYLQFLHRVDSAA